MGFAEWWQGLQRRLSRRSAQLQLGQRNLYILPSRFGSVWLLAAAALYLLGIHARSNTPVLLGFLMVALMGLGLFLTHLNLQGMRLQVVPQELAFAGEVHPYTIEVESRSWRPSLHWRWLEPQAPSQQSVHIHPGRQRLALNWRARQRGQQQPGRLLLHTTAPLGLFRCWAYWEPPEAIALAPAPIPGPVANACEPSPGPIADQWQGLEAWRTEQGLQRLDWKALARGKGWHGKTFESDEPLELSFKPMPNMPIEQALAHLCATVLEALEAGISVGLELPGGPSIPPGSGKAHRERCLLALAEVPQQGQRLG